MSLPPQISYVFGEFRLDATGGMLYKEGRPLSLPVKAAETLRILVENHGRMVRREELISLVWPDAFVEEANLTVVISQLRKALGDSRESPQFIETAPKRGYRFIASVEVEAAPPPAAQPATPRKRKKLAWFLAAFAAVVLATAVASLLPPPVPRAVNPVQLTHTGLVDSGPNLATDGVRVYFTQRQGGHWGLYQVSADGGEPSPIATPFPNTTLYDLSPDGSTLLVGSFEAVSPSTVWTLPVTGGVPKRLGSVMARDAAWTPDGRVVYTRASSVYIVNGDGTASREIARVEGYTSRPRLDPGGRTIRFVEMDQHGDSAALWQAKPDGSELRRLSPIAESGSGANEGESDGSWSRDGRLFLFRSSVRSSGGGNRGAIWAVSAGRPVQLYSSPLSLFSPVLSPDQRRLFLIARQERFELTEYQEKTRNFVPYLHGMSANAVSFTADGNWMTYTSLPDRILWRSRPDTSERVQLTNGPLEAFSPRWSPDGRRIAFMGLTPATKQQGIYVVPARGGEPAKVFGGAADNVTWSPDGGSLLFAAADEHSQSRFLILDLAGGKTSVLPASEGLNSPAWSLDGKYVSAVSASGRSLLLFDFAAGRWTDLAQGNLVSRNRWAADGSAVYFQDGLGTTQPIFRIRVPGGKPENLTPDPVFPAGVTAYGFAGITPSGKILATLIRNNSDIYGMRLEPR